MIMETHSPLSYSSSTIPSVPVVIVKSHVQYQPFALLAVEFNSRAIITRLTCTKHPSKHNKGYTGWTAMSTPILNLCMGQILDVGDTPCSVCSVTHGNRGSSQPLRRLTFVSPA